MRVVWVILLTLLILMPYAAGFHGVDSAATPIIAGFRASRLLSNYPNNEFPSPDYWARVGAEMAGKFNGTIPGGVWIVSLYQDNGGTEVSFPSNGTTYPHIEFSETDYNEAYLAAFDKAGLRIWLQVEPGAADVNTLIQLVLQRYRHHASVAGFGIDVEWYNSNTSPSGLKITDNEAQEWEQHVKAVDSSYRLFLKHWEKEWMPPTYRGSILFVDDSQGFPSLTEVTTQFGDWARFFAPNMAGFQFGYEADASWWRQYSDPAKTIGDAILSKASNIEGLFWVDFTITQVFPLLAATTYASVSAISSGTPTSTQVADSMKASQTSLEEIAAAFLSVALASAVAIILVRNRKTGLAGTPSQP